MWNNFVFKLKVQKTPSRLPPHAQNPKRYFFLPKEYWHILYIYTANVCNLSASLCAVYQW